MNSRYLRTLIAVGGVLVAGGAWCGLSAWFSRFDAQASHTAAPQALSAQTPINIATTTSAQAGSSNPTVDTTGWGSYYSSKFHFSVDYPKTANVYHRLADGKVHIGEEVAEASERFGVDLREYLGIMKETTQECAGTLGVTGVLGVNINSYAIPATDVSIGTWVARNVIFYERQAPDPTFSEDTTFQGEPAFYFERPIDTQNDGLCALTQYSWYFFHRDSVYSITGVKLPAQATDQWKRHPLYSYIVQSVPISEAIIRSFRFATREDSSTSRRESTPATR